MLWIFSKRNKRDRACIKNLFKNHRWCVKKKEVKLRWHLMVLWTSRRFRWRNWTRLFQSQFTLGYANNFAIPNFQDFIMTAIVGAKVIAWSRWKWTILVTFFRNSSDGRWIYWFGYGRTSAIRIAIVSMLDRQRRWNLVFFRCLWICRYFNENNLPLVPILIKMAAYLTYGISAVATFTRHRHCVDLNESISIATRCNDTLRAR